MSIHPMCTSIRTIVQARLAEIRKDLGSKPLIRDMRNLLAGRRHRSSAFVAAAMLRRYRHVYLVNADFMSFPRIELAEYRTLSTDDVPLVRVREEHGKGLIQARDRMIPFLKSGATLVSGDGEPPYPMARDVIQAIAVNGWHILTVDDARCVLEGRDIATSSGGYLTTCNGWLTVVEKDADARGIAESLFPFCEQVVANRAATMVIYTPTLPKPLKLWRLSLRWIMPPLPPVV
ncbi:MAG: hypothetical protein AB1586_02785 [Pseudomonadota bacterium]